MAIKKLRLWLMIGLSLGMPLMSFANVSANCNGDNKGTSLSQLDCEAIHGGWTSWVPEEDLAKSDNCDDATTTLTGNDNYQKAFNFFVGKGLTDVQAAAIIGNLMQESHVNPNDVNPTSGAYGIAQWLGGRLTNLKNFAQERNQDVSSLAVQLDFLWKELTSSYQTTVLNPVKATDDLATGVDIVLRHFEVPCATSDDSCWAAENTNRLRFAQDVLKLYSAQGGAGVQSTDVSGCNSAGGTNGGAGSGTGAFTTDTTAAAYPGLQKMLQYAQKVAMTKAPSSNNPVPQATKDFCAKLPSATCMLHCMAAVGEVWTHGPSGYIDPNTAWNGLIPAEHKHARDRHPPLGALLFYNAPGDVHGHIAVYVGDNLAFSTDILGAGEVYIASADLIEGAKWGMNYVGWSDPYFYGKVY